MASFTSVINLPNLQSVSIRLDRNNYSFWRIQILSTVRAHGFDDLIDKYKIPPSQYLLSPSGDCIPNQDFLSWIRRDQFLVSWILSSIGESMLGYVTRCATAKDIWLVLENLFQSISKARVMQLQLQLHTQKKGDLTVDAYFLKMREIADQLAAAGKPMADDDLCLQILGGFGAEYDAVVVNLTSRPDELNLQEVQFALQAHEIRIQSQNLFSPSAHVVYNNRSGGRGYPTEYYPSSGGRFSRGRGGGRMVYRDNRITCQLCGRPGHVALKCFKRFDIHFTGVTSSTPQAYITDVGFGDHSHTDCYYEHDSTLDPSWYVDSGATNHITHDAHNLSCNVPYHGNEQVPVGNGSQLPINVVGKSTLTSSSANSYPLFLNNILYVPKITKNLVSISQFTKDNAVFIEFHHDSCLVKDNHTKQVVMKGILTKGLYQLSSSPTLASSSKPGIFLANTSVAPSSALNTSSSSKSLQSCTDSIKARNTDSACMSSKELSIWHNRLVHANDVVCTKVIKHVTGQSVHNDFYFCEACKQGKIHQKSHVTQTTKTSQPFQLVHSDVWRPSYTASTQGFKYYIHFVDDFTRFTWIYPIKAKSEVGAIVKNFLAMIKCQFQKSIQAFQSDWGVNTDHWYNIYKN